jgi:Rps23 Pro-64 3,4-dihydroxylase Tpa1-like proline 4-hydroxylase
VLQLLRPSLLEQSSKLQNVFLHARPFRHLVIDRFLTESFCEELCREFPPFHERNAVNELGTLGRKAVVPALRRIGPAYERFDRLMQSRDFRALVARLTGIPGLLYDAEYFGGGTHENRAGQELDIHIDFNYHPRTHTHRRLNLIVFLNPEWKEEWGGCLELHENPWGPPSEDFTVTVLPLRNRCVIFETTSASWHGFREIKTPPDRSDLSRRSIAVYFYTKERPAEEIAPRHSTVYVPQHIPEYLRAGHTLSTPDVERLEVLFQRRDDQIRYLYEREKEILAVLDSITRSPTFRAARLVAAPARMLRSAMHRRRRSGNRP